jgi:hypothetical protein
MKLLWWAERIGYLVIRTKGGQAFNMVTQKDSQATVRISEAALSDSTAMKTVAVLTLAFLPATFVSVSR